MLPWMDETWSPPSPPQTAFLFFFFHPPSPTRNSLKNYFKFWNYFNRKISFSHHQWLINAALTSWSGLNWHDYWSARPAPRREKQYVFHYLRWTRLVRVNELIIPWLIASACYSWRCHRKYWCWFFVLLFPLVALFFFKKMESVNELNVFFLYSTSLWRFLMTMWLFFVFVF